MSLYERLADAYSKPSKTYQAIEEALGSVPKVLGAIDYYNDRKDKYRKRELQQQTLEQALGGQVPEDVAGFKDLTIENATNLATPLTAISRFRDRTHLVNPLDNEIKQLQIQNLRNPQPKPRDPLDDQVKRAQIKALEARAAAGARKVADTQEKKDSQLDASINQADRIINKVDQAMNNVGWWTTGLVGAGMGMIPGTDASNLKADLDTIKANLGFAELQAMRQASPTGGALGQIAVQELNALQSTVASLSQAQSDDQLRARLGEIATHYKKWKEAVTKAKTSTGDPEADAAIEQIMQSNVSDDEKQARIQGVRGAAGL